MDINTSKELGKYAKVFLATKDAEWGKRYDTPQIKCELTDTLEQYFKSISSPKINGDIVLKALEETRKQNGKQAFVPGWLLENYLIDSEPRVNAHKILT